MVASARFVGVVLLDERHLTQNLVCAAEEFPSHKGGREPFPRAEKEGDAKFLLEFAKDGSQQGLSHKQGFGSGGQGTTLGNHIDITEPTQSHEAHLIS